MAATKRKRSPAAKKALDYKKQRRGFTEYKHSLRHGKWRRNKRRPAQQTERQAGRSAVAARSSAELKDPGFDPGAIARPKIQKRSVASLRDWVTYQTQRRVRSVGAKKRRRTARTR